MSGTPEFTRLVKKLAHQPTKSTKDMDWESRCEGIRQMLVDLHQMASKDGCVAAAWAVEWFSEWGKKGDRP
jgi:hypothetical protein